MFDTSASGLSGPSNGGASAGGASNGGTSVGGACPGEDPAGGSPGAGAPGAGTSESAAAAVSGAVGEAGEFASSLAGLSVDVPAAVLIDRIRVLEEVKSAAAAAQARAAAAFDAACREDRPGAVSGAAGRKPRVRAGGPVEGVAAQIALARRVSPFQGNRHLGFGRALVHEMPHTLKALSTGVLSEWRATILVRETACLSIEDRAAVDEAVAADPSALEGVGDRRLASEAKKHAYRLDPYSLVRRTAKAESERTVTCRPAPETMTYLTGLLPAAQGIAVKTALTRAADHHIRVAGDERGRGQIMADTLVERVTGRRGAQTVPAATSPDHGPDNRTTSKTGHDSTANGIGAQDGAARQDGAVRQDGPDQSTAGVPAVDGNNRQLFGAGIEVQLIMTDRALFAGDNEPAYLHGYGTVPASWARNLIRGSDTEAENTNGTGSNGTGLSDTGRVWIRRLYTNSGTGRLTGMDSTARIFPQGLRRFLISRDRTCRTPWCDAPIRHIDHITAHSKGGTTSEANGQGLCQRCNLAKEAPGFTSIPVPGQRHTVQFTTPTGHAYHSTAPPPPGTTPT